MSLYLYGVWKLPYYHGDWSLIKGDGFLLLHQFFVCKFNDLSIFFHANTCCLKDMNFNSSQITCPGCVKKKFISKDGFYFRRNDSRRVQRFVCSYCGKKFSRASFELEYRQKKRRVNHTLFLLLASGISMRRCALILRLHRTTVMRKFIYLAEKSRQIQRKILADLQENRIQHMQFDDLITIEHTKLKPLSVSAAIDAQRRLILGAEVSRIPSFGLLAKRSRKKYGTRPNQHREGLTRLFNTLQNVIAPEALIQSDEHKTYPEFVARYFPHAEYRRYKGGRGCVTGQGELKKQHYDPLFKLNHTYAMLRANINRLFRRTWCTTKDPAMLKNHLDIYIAFHNTVLV